jgi:membrane protein implicated in regulation of membrane protease activity
MTWWYWLVLGLLLLGAEMLSPSGFYLLFFGLAAIVVGAIAGFGLMEPGWMQWLSFSILSVVFVLVLRPSLIRRSKTQVHTSDNIDTLVGETAVLLQDLLPGAVGKAELRGAVWNVRNTGQTPLTKGQRSRVVRVDGLMLLVKPE